MQRLAEVVSVPVAGEHFRRRPLHEVEAAGLEVTQRERFALGVVERIVATKPTVRASARIQLARSRPIGEPAYCSTCFMPTSGLCRCPVRRRWW